MGGERRGDEGWGGEGREGKDREGERGEMRGGEEREGKVGGKEKERGGGRGKGGRNGGGKGGQCSYNISATKKGHAFVRDAPLKLFTKLPTPQPTCKTRKVILTSVHQWSQQ